jgi:hypothetical protein
VPAEDLLHAEQLELSEPDGDPVLLPDGLVVADDRRVDLPHERTIEANQVGFL